MGIRQPGRVRTAPVVQDASLQVARGKIFIVMGLSGPGKSTLLHCLTGLHAITRGEVIIGGVNIATASATALPTLRRDKIGMVFQSFALLPHLSALHNAAFPPTGARRGQGRRARASPSRRTVACCRSAPPRIW